MGGKGTTKTRALNWGSFSGGCLVVELPAAAFRVSLSLSPSFTCSLLNYSSSQLPPWWNYGIHILMADHGTMNNFLFKAFANFSPTLAVLLSLVPPLSENARVMDVNVTLAIPVGKKGLRRLSIRFQGMS